MQLIQVTESDFQLIRNDKKMLFFDEQVYEAECESKNYGQKSNN
jgi:hypothetical protein